MIAGEILEKLSPVTEEERVCCENGKVLEDFYKEKGGKLKSITRSMGKHHPHGLDDPTPIIEFVE